MAKPSAKQHIQSYVMVKDLPKNTEKKWEMLTEKKKDLFASLIDDEIFQ